ncbi:Thioesterase-like superfamily protein [Geodermatophilus pulveris]|uniref:Thioesterase-like superfamily protein n=1 Tax=Geodermatophilus pulveris TaxID=1564159 RepID=A0A239HVQ0_9ACTN|nr:thioesterase family protein [Geodermatophilus pulveris]SNS85208.1 Thioesterase-like superfamily protein [Geodermatophilus pulveris]
MTPAPPSALYLPEGDGYRATDLTIGPWDPALQHAGPVAALLAREAERVSAIPAGQTVRLAFDILAPVPVGPVQVAARLLRPGRRIELVEAVLTAGDSPADRDRPLVRLTAWRLRTSAVEPTPEAGVPLPGPEQSRPETAAFFTTDVAYHRALDWRFAHGSFNAPGPAAAWTRPLCTLVEGEPMSPLQHLLVMTDAASGISAVLDWTRTTFANIDLTVALLRPPAGEWLGVDAATTIGPAGAGQCFADLHDATGRIGRSAQALFVETR